MDAQGSPYAALGGESMVRALALRQTAENGKEDYPMLGRCAAVCLICGATDQASAS